MTELRNPASIIRPAADGNDGRLDIASLPKPPAWVEQALCAEFDLEAFFPDKGQGTSYAKSVCAMCPVTTQCLAYALENGERHGVWGGLSERERRRMGRTA